MSEKQIIKYLLLRTLGNFLILFMIFGFVFTFGPAVFFEARFRIEQARGISYELPQNEPTELAKIIQRRLQRNEPVEPGLFGAVLANKKVQTLYPADTSFSIVIPKIGANEKVTANVDPTNGDEYLSVLQDNVAHARGSALPGLNGTTYLFAHSADNFWDVGRYNAVFYLIKDLEAGDDIALFFNDKRYNYAVYDKKVVNPEEVEYLAANIGQGEKLILQTCWPPGTTWKRMLVFAKPKNN